MFASMGGESELCYMQEILDSAQENYAHLWVNGEKYVFSDDVIQAGNELMTCFLNLKQTVEKAVRLSQQRVDGLLNTDFSMTFLAFDEAWTRYE